MNNIPFIDENNNILGYMDRMKVHEKGLLHPAFSLFVFDQNKKLILPKRAERKYHCPNLWSNTMCSHPESNIIQEDEIRSNLYRELRMSCGKIIHLYDFIYKKEFPNGLIEHERDSVYLSFSNEKPNMNPLEVSMVQHSSMKNIYENVENRPDKYTFWFKEIIKDKKFVKKLNELELI